MFGYACEMGLSALANCAFFACCLCFACGGGHRQDETHSDSGTAGALALGGSAGDASGPDHAGSVGDGGRANAGGNASNGGNASKGGGPSEGKGGASSGSGGSTTSLDYTGPGTVTAPWNSYCIATLTADFAALDPLQNPLFTARVGEQYLIEVEFDAHWARLLYLTPVGPLEFDIKTDSTEVPFTSNCGPTQTLSHYANFADVVVYAERQLVTKLCDLTAGTTVPYDASKGRGATFDLGADSNDVDKIFLNGFSARCNGADTGYTRAKSVTVSGTLYSVVPFVAIAGS